MLALALRFGLHARMAIQDHETERLPGLNKPCDSIQQAAEKLPSTRPVARKTGKSVRTTADNAQFRDRKLKGSG
jgi:hypothetical protein